jgi:uncharacterized radical SAM protein YgiQ
MERKFLPVSRKDLEERHWSHLDIILVSGDAYVDHPAYCAAVIGRVLEDAGFKVGIIAQPDWRTKEDFLKLGQPRLCFGITAGNLDSLVANYTANKRPRKKDDYSPGGKTGLRPDRASIVYANKIREVFPHTSIVLGGIEASLRRLAHYDYWDDAVRRSILLDARADILVYGMGERQILEIARRLSRGEDLYYVRGTAVVRESLEGLRDFAVIPSFEEVKSDKNKFNQAFKTLYLELDPFRGKTIVQKHQERFVIQFPPALPLSTEALDRIYALPYVRRWHPIYEQEKGVPGLETVRFSVISHRGCCGECSFCALYAHQGRIVQSRSQESILKEIESLARQKDFRGTISDIGGPTANLYKTECRLWEKEGACRNKKCLFPKRCENLKLDYARMLSIWDGAGKIAPVKHIFMGSGFRYDLLLDKDAERYLEMLCKYHTSGQLKVAPEHIADEVLEVMQKPKFSVYRDFVEKFKKINRRLNKKQYLVNYFISAHPGADLKTAFKLSLYLKNSHLHPEQVQDFIPLPLTLSGCIYYTARHPFSGKEIYVARTFRERKMQRAFLQYRQSQNKKLIRQAQIKLDKV